MQNQGSLKGITVLDLSRLLPGPYASMILADHGARVISVEDKRFLADGLFMTTVNRNKEHVSLNLKTEAGREIFFKLAQRSDVVMEGFRPGVVDRLGVGYEAVRRVRPDVIYCAITGFGQDGPFRDRAGHDVNYISQAGVLGLIGEADRPPSIPGVQIADMVGGSMNAVIGILLALHHRDQTGQGQYIDISMTDGSAALLPLAQFFRDLTGEPPRRGDMMLSHRYACYNTYETADGRHLSIGAVENRFWKNLCDYFGVPEFTPLQYDDNRRVEIIDFFRQRFKTRTLDQWTEALQPLDVCFGRIQSFEEVFADPLFIQRQMVVDLPDADGRPGKALGVPVKLSASPGAVRTPAVAFGASTRAVLAELGYSAADIHRLVAEGVI
ncbi:MAG: CaiB/BaiF CoA-transferase family protein [Desulfobacteraceae bacterium]|nr:CaiB/BaiF CoA-transferase family protein [Desulfobacteraceae bacterium]